MSWILYRGELLLERRLPLLSILPFLVLLLPKEGLQRRLQQRRQVGSRGHARAGLLQGGGQQRAPPGQDRQPVGAQDTKGRRRQRGGRAGVEEGQRLAQELLGRGQLFLRGNGYGK